MWLFTPFGFFSVVQEPNETRLCVRTRMLADLNRLREYAPTLSAPAHVAGRDYEVRAWCSRAALAGAMGKVIDDINYSNFKNEATARSGRYRAGVYEIVWAVLRQLASPAAELGRRAVELEAGGNHHPFDYAG